MLELEKLYNILIDVEDCEKKLAVLPTGIPLRSQVEVDGKEGIKKFGLQLVREDKLKLYMTVRKGKSLLIRALRWLNTAQMRIVVSTLLQNYSLAVKKDRDDRLLKEFWLAGIRRHILSCSSLGILHLYLAILTSDKSASILKHVVTTPLGMSIILGIIQRLSTFQDATGKTRTLLVNLGQKLQQDHANETFCAAVSPYSVQLPHLFNNKDLDSDYYQQLQKLVHAGLQQQETN